MKYEINNKKINIPDQEIEKSMKLLDITQEQAIEMYLCDHDYIKNEEVENLTKKAKENGADKIINRKVIKKSGETTRKPKENPLKEQIIANLHNFLLQNNDFVNIIVTNNTKGGPQGPPFFRLPLKNYGQRNNASTRRFASATCSQSRSA